MLSVMLSGRFGLGDLAQEGRLSALLAALGDQRVLASSLDPAWTARVHGCEVVDERRRGAVLEAAAGVDALVLVGDAVFGGRRGAVAGLSSQHLAASVARMRGARVGILACDVPHLSERSACRAARALARRAELLVLSESASVGQLVAAGLPAPFRVGADPLWLLFDPRPSPKARSGRRSVAVVVDRHTTTPRNLWWLTRAVGKIAGDVDVTLCPWHFGRQAPDLAHAARTIAAAVPNAEVLTPPTDLVAAVERLRDHGVVVTASKSALIAAAGVGTPSVAIGGHRSLDALSRRLRQPVIRFGEPSEALGSICEAQLVDGRVASPAAVRAQIAAADDTVTLLRLLVGADDSAAIDVVPSLSLEPTPW